MASPAILKAALQVRQGEVKLAKIADPTVRQAIRNVRDADLVQYARDQGAEARGSRIAISGVRPNVRFKRA